MRITKREDLVAFIRDVKNRSSNGLLITGLPGSGKSTVTQLLTEAKIPVLDLDHFGTRVNFKVYKRWLTLWDTIPTRVKGTFPILAGISDNLQGIAIWWQASAGERKDIDPVVIMLKSPHKRFVDTHKRRSENKSGKNKGNKKKFRTTSLELSRFTVAQQLDWQQAYDDELRETLPGVKISYVTLDLDDIQPDETGRADSEYHKKSPPQDEKSKESSK